MSAIDNLLVARMPSPMRYLYGMPPLLSSARILHACLKLKHAG